MRTLIVWSVLFVGLVFFSACDSWSLGNYGGLGDPCFENGTCNGALSCCDDVCLESCEAGGDPDGEGEDGTEDPDIPSEIDADTDLETDETGDTDLDDVTEDDADDATEQDADLDDVTEDDEETDEIEAEEDQSSTVIVRDVGPSSGTFFIGEELPVTWSCNAPGTDYMKVSIKRDAYLGNTLGENYQVLAPYTRNDGSELLIVPSGIKTASDWRVWVKHDTTFAVDYSGQLTFEESTEPDGDEEENDVECTCSGVSTCCPDGCTPAEDGTACDSQDQCLSGACVDCIDVSGCGDVVEDTNPCTSLACVQNACVELNDDQNTCDSDGLDCIAEVCESGSCVVDEILSGCYIDSTCTEENVLKGLSGDGSCRICSPLNHDNAWTILTTGPCDDGDPCSYDDTCGTGGACEGTSYTCQHGGTCTGDGTCTGCEHRWSGDLCEVCDTEAGLFVHEGDCLEAVPDYDHDGLCFSPDCDPVEADTCPTVWNPDNDPSLCDAWSLHSAEFSAQRTVTLSQDGENSTWRRTNEPVEIPLVNGILDDSVVGYWKLGNGEARDYSGNGNDGVLVDEFSPAFGAFNDANGALHFNGGTNYIEISDDSTNRGGDTFSVSVWFMTNTGGARQIIAKGNTNSRGHWRIGYTTQLVFVVSDTALYQHYTRYETVDFIDGQFHHVVGVFNRGTLNLYLDGILIDTIDSRESEFIWDNQQPLEIGHQYDMGYFYGGSIDEVLLFNRALSPDEIRAYYDSRAPYGTKHVPGAQDDFDDLRITETSAQIDNATDEHLIPHEILGPRPHSDTPCPAEYDDLDPAEIPHIADREDLCGVVGYWKLDGNGEDSSGIGNHLVNLGSPFLFTRSFR